MYKYILIVAALVIIQGCGEGIVEIDSKIYEPRIVIYGFIEPGRAVKDISITRNFPLNQKVNPDSLYLKDADAIITDLNINKSYKLDFNAETKTFQRLDMVIAKGRSYKLSISALIDGVTVEAFAVTNVPEELPEIDTTRSKLEPFHVFDKDENGEFKCFEVCWKFSSDEDCYIFTKETLNISDSNKIWSMPFEAWELMYAKYGYHGYPKTYHMIDFVYNKEKSNGYHSYVIESYFFAYHGAQRFIVTTGDKNFLDYIKLPREVVDVDGNHFEPKYHVSGMGIGVFGSWASDTVEVMLLPRNYGSN